MKASSALRAVLSELSFCEVEEVEDYDSIAIRALRQHTCFSKSDGVELMFFRDFSNLDSIVKKLRQANERGLKDEKGLPEIRDFPYRATPPRSRYVSSMLVGHGHHYHAPWIGS